jgi:hypothetical protein
MIEADKGTNAREIYTSRVKRSLGRPGGISRVELVSNFVGNSTRLIGVVEGIAAARENQRGKMHSWWSCERESPEASPLRFPPSFEDAVALAIKDRHIRFGEDNFAILVCKWAQTDEGVGK